MWVCVCACLVCISTYSQIDLSALGDLLGQDAQEVEDGGMAGHVFAESGHDGRQHILPLLHLDGERRQADAQLQSDGLRARREDDEQLDDLVSQRRQLGRRYLGRDVVRNLERVGGSDISFAPPSSSSRGATAAHAMRGNNLALQRRRGK